MIRYEDRAPLASDHLVHVRHGFLEGHVSRRDHDDGEIFVNQRNRPVFEFSGGITLGMNVGYFLKLKCTFQRKRIVGSTPDKERVAGRRYLASELADLRFQLKRTRHVAWNIGERPRQRHLVVGREHAPIPSSRYSKARK